MWFVDRATIEPVLSDNDSAYHSCLWQHTCEALSITPKRTQPYRPQANGTVERFHRTMADGWVYARCYRSEQERRCTNSDWPHNCHHRPRRGTPSPRPGPPTCGRTARRAGAS